MQHKAGRNDQPHIYKTTDRRQEGRTAGLCS